MYIYCHYVKQIAPAPYANKMPFRALYFLYGAIIRELLAPPYAQKLPFGIFLINGTVQCLYILFPCGGSFYLAAPAMLGMQAAHEWIMYEDIWTYITDYLLSYYD